MLAVWGPAQGTSCSGWILRDTLDSALSCTGARTCQAEVLLQSVWQSLGKVGRGALGGSDEADAGRQGRDRRGLDARIHGGQLGEVT